MHDARSLLAVTLLLLASGTSNDQPGGFEALPPQSRAMFLDNARTVRLQATAPTTPTTCTEAGRLSVPVLITKGELTRPFFRVVAEATSRCIPRSKLIAIEGARHCAPAQYPTAFNEVLIALLEKQPVRTPAATPDLGAGVKSVRVNGYDMAYVERGSGQTVLLVPGSRRIIATGPPRWTSCQQSTAWSP